MKWLFRPPSEQPAPEPSELGCLTDSEIQDITRGMSKAMVRRFNAATTTLLMVKERLDDRTPWRELVDVIARFPARWVTLDIINSKGAPETIEAFVNRGNGQHGLHLALVSATLEFSDLLEEIESERTRNKLNGSKGGRPLAKDVTSKEIAIWLMKRDYSQSDNKKELVIDAMEYHGVKRTRVTDAITEHGLARKSSRKGKNLVA